MSRRIEIYPDVRVDAEVQCLSARDDADAVACVVARTDDVGVGVRLSRKHALRLSARLADLASE